MPAIETATAVLKLLMFEFEDIISELVPSERAISAIGSAFNNLGTALIELLPSLVELAVTLTREFLPPFVEFVENVGPQIPGMIESLVGVFQRMLPEFQAMGRFLSRFIPEFTRFGFLTLRVITPAISGLANVLLDGVSALNRMDRGLAGIVTAATILTPVVAGLAALLGGPVTLALAGVVGGAVALAKAWSSNFAGMRDDAQRLWNIAQPVLMSLDSAFQSFIEGANVAGIRRELGEFISVLDTQLSTVIASLKPVFEDFQMMLADNSEELGIIGGAVGDVLRAVINLGTYLLKGLGPVFNMVVIPAFQSFIDIIDFGLEKLSQFITVADEIQAGDISGAIDAAGPLFGVGESPELNVDAPSQTQGNQELRDQIQEIRVTVENGEIVGKMDERAQEQLRNQERQNRRQSGRSASPR